MEGKRRRVFSLSEAGLGSTEGAREGERNQKCFQKTSHLLQCPLHDPALARVPLRSRPWA